MKNEIKKYFALLRHSFSSKSKSKLLHNTIIVLIIFFLLLTINTCSENPVAEKPINLFPIPPLYFGNLAWHPTSNWIAVLHADSVDLDADGINEGSFYGVWLINAFTGEKKPFLEIGDAWLAWNKDGKKLAMEIGGQIYTINIPSIEPIEIDTASLTQLTFESGYFPSFSPDGQWIVYDSGQDSPGPNYVWKMTADGSQKKCISMKGTGEWRMPDWSPTNDLIVYQRYVGVGGAEIFIMDSSGSSQVRLTNDLNHDQYPKFSKSGEVIGFHSQPPVTGPRAIWTIHTDGTGLKKVSPDWAYLFDFSPDGSKIAFVLYGPDSTAIGNGQLWTMDSDGSDLIQLTNFKP